MDERKIHQQELTRMAREYPVGHESQSRAEAEWEATLLRLRHPMDDPQRRALVEFLKVIRQESAIPSRDISPNQIFLRTMKAVSFSLNAGVPTAALQEAINNHLISE